MQHSDSVPASPSGLRASHGAASASPPSASVPNADVVHFITADKANDEGNLTACGERFVFPMRGNGWRVRDITCPECDRVICDLAHAGLEGDAQPDAGAHRNQGDHE